MGNCSSGRKSTPQAKPTQEEFDAEVDDAMDNYLMNKEQASKYVRKLYKKRKVDLSGILIGFQPMDPKLVRSSLTSHAPTEASDDSENGYVESNQRGEDRNRIYSPVATSVQSGSSYTYGVNIDVPVLDMSSHETLMF